MTFTEDFERRFQDARGRVSDSPTNKKPNGSTPSNFKTEGEIPAPAKVGSVSLNDFWGYMPIHTYIFAPTGDMWPASSVDSRLPSQPLISSNQHRLVKADRKPVTIKATRWLDKHRPVGPTGCTEDQKCTAKPGEDHEYQALSDHSGDCCDPVTPALHECAAPGGETTRQRQS